MKIRDVIARVRGALKEYNADSRVTNKHIYNTLKTGLGFLLNRETTKRQFYLQSNIWTTMCIDMIKVNGTACLNIPSNCTVWRSKEQLPNFIESDSGFIYKEISTIDGSNSIKLTNSSTAFSYSKLKYNKNKYVWIENNYLYSLSSYPKLKIVGLFEFDNNCSALESNLKCSDILIDALVKLSLQEFLGYKQIPEDIVQNKNNNN